MGHQTSKQNQLGQNDPISNKIKSRPNINTVKENPLRLGQIYHLPNTGPDKYFC